MEISRHRSDIVPTTDVHRCASCGGWLRPNIVLFGESCDPKDTVRLFTFIKNHRPEVCYVIGSSMRFQYLFNIVNKAKSKGAKIIHVNTDPNYMWHTHKMKYDGRLIRKKKPEILMNALL